LILRFPMLNKSHSSFSVSKIVVNVLYRQANEFYDNLCQKLPGSIEFLKGGILVFKVNYYYYYNQIFYQKTLWAIFVALYFII